jgi:hypothetical protein
VVKLIYFRRSASPPKPFKCSNLLSKNELRRLHQRSGVSYVRTFHAKRSSAIFRSMLEGSATISRVFEVSKTRFAVQTNHGFVDG